MKIKNLMKSLLALVCMMTVTFSFTSCSSDDDETLIITYVAEGSLVDSSGSMMGVLVAIPEYTEAIGKMMGGLYLTTTKDSEIVKACDAVYQRQRTAYPTLKGNVEIHRGESNTEGETVTNKVIKTYKYE
ncbi:hypothetical protein JN06_00174 [Bacteroides zoogleoformans]|uniref:Uncharacterized protein n=1 Tax=Bacteroides zoogleoformans TaxID=28119 RepID=A0ABM6T7Q2_9BACE|nr:hypothetical protein [Bacteroides zoogleoformans]AVM52885.1 hypothetical protein C4H11_07995 [Bacteroides zoogleoformans]TWJ18586.1 hypothetical protein JN06_00174 [Bacteroides zoogleoformans]